jgi:hypothetical protein
LLASVFAGHDLHLVSSNNFPTAGRLKHRLYGL